MADFENNIASKRKTWIKKTFKNECNTRKSASKFESQPKFNCSNDRVVHDIEAIFRHKKSSIFKFFSDVAFPAENDLASFDVDDDQIEAPILFQSENANSVSADDCFEEIIKIRFELNRLNNLSIRHAGIKINKSFQLFLHWKTPFGRQPEFPGFW